jgi:hypothetical protein
VSGILAQDVVSFDANLFFSVPSFTFLLGGQQTGFKMLSGLLGMERPSQGRYPQLIDQLYALGKIAYNIFAFYTASIPEEIGSVLQIGDIDTGYFRYSSASKNKLEKLAYVTLVKESRFWEVIIDGVQVGTKRICPDKPADAGDDWIPPDYKIGMFDTGYSLLGVPASLYSNLMK